MSSGSLIFDYYLDYCPEVDPEPDETPEEAEERACAGCGGPNLDRYGECSGVWIKKPVMSAHTA
jgi:hypothetical protein